MHTTTILLVAMTLLACIYSRSSRTKPAWSGQLKGWQKVFGLVAAIVALLILINPEFLALGLLGDTAFFDMLVLALGLQMHLFVTRGFHHCVDALWRGLRWVGIPSPGLRYCLTVLTPVVAATVAMFQRTMHRDLP